MTGLRPSRARRLVTTLATVGAAVTLAACGTGVNAQTAQWYDPADGVNNDVDMTLDGMAVRGIVIVSDGTDATVVGTFVNQGVDTDGVAEILVEGEDADIDGDLDVEPGLSVRLGPPGEARAQADGVDVQPGAVATVTISFDTAPQEELVAQVVAPEGAYEESGPE